MTSDSSTMASGGMEQQQRLEEGSFLEMEGVRAGGSCKMAAEDLCCSGTAALVTEPQFAQLFRKHLQKEGILHRGYRVQKLPDGTVALPVLSQSLMVQHLQQLKKKIPPGRTCVLTWIQNPIPSKAAKAQSPVHKLRDELQHFISTYGAAWSEELEKDLPCSWQRHGDLVLLSEDSFKATLWENLGQELWKVVAGALGAQRLAKRGHVQSDLFRSPTVTLLLGQDGWVEHVDNGIRIASLRCAGEIVVDLYAGIGYFTLPYLVHAGAAFVHACEWNPYAVEALKKNLELNGVQDQCHIHLGDNRKAHELPHKLMLDHSNGQCLAQRVSNGQDNKILQGDHNILQDAGKRTPVPTAKYEWQRWAEVTATRIRTLLEELDEKPWRTKILHIEQVKSYAPHVHHLVLDLECQPFT
ncbi:hypothetical protein JD844_004464 [Phrynosoma platyrhinos]|uniref:tRNA wybutosine-synthesizing protein 2 homolog n=1 Tax=Phrynosoma platyrhinos TaxID=52577 RepID=A0ABQ7TMU9_PHRPL|nr:hypothetical protein JD844_004464 [Phrynosoma platyrhinos]